MSETMKLTGEEQDVVDWFELLPAERRAVVLKRIAAPSQPVGLTEEECAVVLFEAAREFCLKTQPDLADIKWTDGGDVADKGRDMFRHAARAVLAAVNHQPAPSARDAALEEAAQTCDKIADEQRARSETTLSQRVSLYASLRQEGAGLCAAAIRAMKGGDGKKDEREILIHAADIMDKHDPTNMIGPSLRCFADERLS